jgi:hypothetical protein
VMRQVTAQRDGSKGWTDYDIPHILKSPPRPKQTKKKGRSRPVLRCRQDMYALSCPHLTAMRDYTHCLPTYEKSGSTAQFRPNAPYIVSTTVPRRHQIRLLCHRIPGKGGISVTTSPTGVSVQTRVYFSTRT